MYISDLGNYVGEVLKQTKNNGASAIRAMYAGASSNDVPELEDYDFSGQVLDEDDMVFSDLLYVDSLVQQAVDVPMRDTLESWRTVTDPALEAFESTVEYQYRVFEACVNARKYGYGMIMPVIVDQEGRSAGLSISLDTLLERPDKKYSIFKFIVVKYFEASEEKEKDIRSDNYGNPKFYRVNEKKVDPSRVVIIKANPTGVSFIRSIYPYICAFKTRDYEVTRACQESNFLILGTDMKLLAEMGEARKEMGERGDSNDFVMDFMKNRLADLRENANNNNAYGIDKEGETVTQLQKNNIGAMIDAVEQAVVLLNAAVDIPMRRFMGRGVAGLGDGNDDAIYIQSAEGLRGSMLRSPLKKLDTFVQKVHPEIKNIGYEWNKMKIQELYEEFISLENPVDKVSDVTTDQSTDSTNE